MAENRKQDEHDARQQKAGQDGKLERLAKHIDPSGQEPTNDDLRDPGSMTPAATPTDNRS